MDRHQTLLRQCIRVFALVLFISAAGLHAAEATVATESAQDLVRDVIYNELQDRSIDSFWEYRVERRTGTTNLTAEQIETKMGPIHRLLSREGRPLTSVEEREENARLDQLLQSSSDQARVQQKYQQDEQRLERLMALMPNAFHYEYAGEETGSTVKLRFTPDTSFKPPTYEGRVFHALAGTITVNRRQKRMMHMQGEITDRVDFGWGLLGHIEKGGTFEIERQPVSAMHWKTSLVDVHIDGKVALFKTVAQDQHEVRSRFKPVPVDISLAQARAILDRVAAQSMGQGARRP